MIVRYPNMYNQHWQELSEMIIENYSEGHYEDCVLLCAHQLINEIPEFRKQYPKSKIIVYNLEPVHKKHWISMDWLMKANVLADQVWDYDLQNVEIWRNYGVDAIFKPIQYTASLKRIQNVEEPDIDLLFLGSPTEHRGNYIKQLISAMKSSDDFGGKDNFNFISGHQIWGDLKDNLTSRTKIILNIAPYVGSRQQQTRIYIDLINNKCILSEKAAHNYYGDMIVEFQNPIELAEKVKYLLRDDNWKQYTNNSFEEYCKKNYK